jgi:5-methylcytosine-specific restriction endonuclease McrA
MKRCTRCQTDKPDDAFYRRADGRLRGPCKSCKHTYSEQRAQESEAIDPVQLRHCTACGEHKPAGEFPKNRTKVGGRDSQCKHCTTHRATNWYERNTDRKRAYDADYRIRQAQRRQLMRALRYQRDGARIRSENRERRRRMDPAARNLAANIRWHQRKRRLRAGGQFTKAEWLALCAAYGHRCLCCGTTERLSIDHVIPLSKGGANTIDNLQPLCLPCNQAKGSRVIDFRLSPEVQLLD